MKNLLILVLVSACLTAFSRAVILDRTLLSQWYPNYQTQTNLYLYGRSIDSIASNTFDGLINLQGLYLRVNQLTSLDPTLFKGLINLQGLNLYYNQLTALDPTLFKGLINLKELYLHNNNLTLIE